MTALLRAMQTAGARRDLAPDPAQPKHARRPRLRDVTDVRPRRHSRLGAFLVALVLLSLFGILFVHVQAARSAFELQQLEQSARTKQERNEKLSVVRAYLEAPDRIRREATGRLRMIEPKTVHYLPSEEVNGSGNPAAVPDTKPERRPVTDN